MHALKLMKKLENLLETSKATPDEKMEILKKVPEPMIFESKQGMFIYSRMQLKVLSEMQVTK